MTNEQVDEQTGEIATALASASKDAFSIATNDQMFNSLVHFGEQLVRTGFLPPAIRTGAQVAAIILTGRELGLPPMQSLRLISVIQGKPTLSAELQLGMFVKRGGHISWKESTEVRAVLWLRSPSGDEHQETFTLEDAKRAGLLGKDSWSKYPRFMLRARCATGGLRAIDPGNSLYAPEELGVDIPADQSSSIAVGQVDGLTEERGTDTVEGEIT